MKLSNLKVDVNAIENGTWVSDIPNLPGVRFLVAGMESKAYRKAFARALRTSTTRRERASGNLEADRIQELQRELVAKHCLLDWDGVDNDDGKPVKYDAKLAHTLMTEPEYLPFQQGVFYAINMVDSGDVEFIEETAGN
jgi:hypothetical protein